MPKLTGNRNQCPTCGEFFNSTYAFDKHRTGPFGKASTPAQRRCLKPDEMRAIGMLKNEAGFWVSCRMDDQKLVARKLSPEKAQEAMTKRRRSRPSVPGVPTYVQGSPAASTRLPQAAQKTGKVKP